MKQSWEKLAGRINSLSLRERGVIFLMLAVIIGMFLNLMFLDPLMGKEKTLLNKRLQVEEEVQSLRDKMHLVLQEQADVNTSNVKTKARLEALREQLIEINYSLKNKQQQLIAPDEMTKVLETILIQNRKLQLLALNNLPTTPLVESIFSEKSAVVEQISALGSEHTESAAQVFKHGVEITVQGSYFDLLAYLEALEKIPSQMFWERVRLKVNAYPSSILTFTVYTLSLDKAWLKV